MGFFRVAAQNVADWLAPRASQPAATNDFWYGPPGGATGAGVSITPDLALKASAVLACVKVLAETVASLPLTIVETLATGAQREAPDHPVAEVIAGRPNPVNTAFEFWETMMLHAALRGNAYAEILPGRRGAVDRLIPLHADRVTPQRLANGGVNWEVRDERGGMTRTLIEGQIFRIPGLSSDGVRGLRAVDLAADAIGLGLAAELYGARFFRNDSTPGIVLEHPAQLSREARENPIHAWMLKHAGAAMAHRPAVPQEGMKAHVIGGTPEQARLIELRKQQAIEVARFWRIPLHLMGIRDSQPRANVERESIDFVKYTLRPWCRRIAQAIGRDLILDPARYRARFDLDDLLQGDSAARARLYQSAIQMGWMTRNEVRKREGLNPLPGLDEPLTPLNMDRGRAPGEDGEPEDRDARPAGSAAGAGPVRLIESAAHRLVRREVTAARRIYARSDGDPDAFAAWARSFYGSHARYAEKTLAIPRAAAGTYAAFQRDELLAAIDRETAGAETAVLDLLDRWERSRAAELAETLAGKGD